MLRAEIIADKASAVLLSRKKKSLVKEYSSVHIRENVLERNTI